PPAIRGPEPCPPVSGRPLSGLLRSPTRRRVPWSLPGFALVAFASPVAPALTTTPPPMPNGWLARYLLDPAGFTSGLVHHLLDGLAHAARVVGPPLAAAVVVLVAGRLILARRQGVRQRRGARVVAILPPPEVDPTGAESLWRNLAGQLRPGWRELLRG